MVQRLTYRRRNSYNTPSNKTRIVRTPGHRLVYQYLKKRSKGPSCGDCGGKIHGIPHLPPREMARIKRSQRTISRAYGVRACGRCVRKRITMAFLTEEHKIVKSILKAKARNSQPTKDATTPTPSPSNN